MNSLQLIFILLLLVQIALTAPTPYKDKIRIFVKHTVDVQQIKDITNSAVMFFENLLKMNTVSPNPIKLNSDECTDCDVLLITDNTSCTDIPYPVAEILQQSDAPFSRVGKINFCQLVDQDLKNNYKFKKMVDSVIHGIMKILVFGKPYFQTESYDSTKTCSKSTTYTNLKSKFSSLYGLTNPPSLPVKLFEDKYYLWDKQYAYQDLMTKNYFQDEKVWSEFNNQILKDIKAFSFVNDKLVQPIVLSSTPNECKKKDESELFCQEEQNSLACNASLTAKSRCNVFDDDTQCRVYLPEVDGNCLDPSLNLKNQSIISAAGTYESYGWDSRCFVSDVQDISSMKYTLPIRCYKYSCDEKDNITIYFDTSDKGNKLGFDSITCTTNLKNTAIDIKNEKYFSSQGLLCPKNNASFCKSARGTCKNFCSSKGVCLNGQCQCLADWYGDDCSCYQIYQFNGKCVDGCPKMYTGDNLNRICKLQCQLHYYFSKVDSKCNQCDSNCESCFDKPNTCLSCYSGYILFTDSTCKKIETSADCTALQYYNGNKCEDCDVNCKTCVVDKSFCTSCLTNQYLDIKTHKCVNCPTNCETCTDIQLCTKCAEGMFVTLLKNECTKICDSSFGYENQCVKECPKGYYANTSNQMCEKCDPSCLTCANKSTFCQSCEYFRTLDNNTCKDNCESSSVYVKKEHGTDSWTYTCVPCSFQEKCQECQGNAVTCTKCLAGFYLYGFKCLEKCPTGYQEEDTTGTCMKCDSTCLTCNLKPTICTSCAMNVFLKNDSCVTNCGEGYFANKENQKCVPTGKTADEDNSKKSFRNNIKLEFIFSIIILVITL